MKEKEDLLKELNGEEEIKEFFDEPEILEEKIKTLADFIINSKFFIVYTGAGISTSAGIPDFRGPNGVWTLKARGIDVPRDMTDQVIPTTTHMSILSLLKAGLLKRVISTNTDGLHLKSGVSPKLLLELHGNKYVEACNRCGRCYWRPHRIRGASKTRATGRFCDICKNKLRYTSVGFNQSMPDLCLEEAENLSKRCDLSLVVGTSMKVYPSCDLPLMGKKKKNNTHKLVIINLQKTKFDDECALRIFARVDDVFEKVMKLLDIEILNYEPIDSNSEEWKQEFSEWKFRRTSNDWFYDKE